MMKLLCFKHTQGYQFNLTFANGETRLVDLTELVSRYVSPDAVSSARLDPEWGCLEFNNGMVDIEPKTLYQYAKKQAR